MRPFPWSADRVRKGKLSARVASLSVFIVLALLLGGSNPVPAWGAEKTEAGRSRAKEKPSGDLPLGSGDLYALVVGVSNYKDPKITRLDLADQDAKVFSDFLKTQDKIFRHAHVTALINEKATKGEVEKYLYYTLPKAGKDDTVVLFFSGHGAEDPIRSKEFLFLPYDAEAEYLGTTSVKMSGLDFLKGVSAERVLIIADACYAGGFSEMKSKAVTKSMELFRREAKNSSGRVIITSSKDGQLSWEVPNQKNSIFTHHFIEGLQGKADKDRDGVVTFDEAYQYAYNRTKEQTGGKQHPQYEGQVVGPFPLSYVGPGLPESELKKALLDAAQSGDLPTAETCISRGADADVRDERNNTPLIIGSRQGHAKVVALLLGKGADVNATNHDRSTALIEAAENGRDEVVKLLLEAGADAHFKDGEGRTALAVAALKGHAKVVLRLLDEGADVKARTASGETPLILACRTGHIEIAKILVDWGADVRATDLGGLSALTLAARHGHPDVVKFLLKSGGDMVLKSRGGLEKQLIIAAMLGDAGRVKVLLGLGAIPDAETEQGDTPLTVAAALGHPEVVTALAARGADVNFRVGHDAPVLVQASFSGRTDVVQLLLTLGADVNARDRDGNTALLCAARNGHGGVVKILLAGKADIEAPNAKKVTPLMAASESGHANVVKLLVTSGSDVRAADKTGNTALMLAARNGYTDIVKLLTSKGAEVNARNSEGTTPLILAARNGHRAVVALLLSKGADPSAEDWEGKTALALASELGRKEVVALLREARN